MGNISPRMRAMSPRSLRERMSRTPRDTPLPPPGDDWHSPDPDKEFAEMCERLRTVFARQSTDKPNTTPEEEASNLSSSPGDYHQLTTSGVHRLRVSIASRLPADEVDSSFWRMTLSPGRA